MRLKHNFSVCVWRLSLCMSSVLLCCNTVTRLTQQMMIHCIVATTSSMHTHESVRRIICFTENIAHCWTKHAENVYNIINEEAVNCTGSAADTKLLVRVLQHSNDCVFLIKIFSFTTNNASSYKNLENIYLKGPGCCQFLVFFTDFIQFSVSMSDPPSATLSDSIQNGGAVVTWRECGDVVCTNFNQSQHSLTLSWLLVLSEHSVLEATIAVSGALLPPPSSWGACERWGLKFWTEITRQTPSRMFLNDCNDEVQIKCCSSCDQPSFPLHSLGHDNMEQSKGTHSLQFSLL